MKPKEFVTVFTENLVCKSVYFVNNVHRKRILKIITDFFELFSLYSSIRSPFSLISLIIEEYKKFVLRIIFEANKNKKIEMDGKRKPSTYYKKDNLVFKELSQSSGVKSI